MKKNVLGYSIPKLVLAVLCALSLTFDVVAERPDNPGNPGNGSGGKPDNPGGGGGKPEKPGRGKGDLYADLVVLHRDMHGLPILSSQPLVEGPGEVMCLQPISANPIPGEDVVINPADGKDTSLIPLGTGIEGEECDVNPAFAQYVQEVLFGRLNVGRAPVKVINQQLREVTSSLASSVLPIDIDEGGRLVWYAGDTLITGVEVDSPGNNLAIHKELQVAAVLVDQTQVPIVLPMSASFLDHAAAALGAAAGKGDLINLDLLVYNNRILDIPDTTTALATIVGDGTNGEAGERYIDYSGYSYNRAATFPGCVRGLLVDFPDIGQSTAFSGSIMDCVFGSIENDGTCVMGSGTNFTGVTAVHAFAQRADDARTVIAFVHDNVVADSTAILPAAIAGVDQAGKDEVCSAP